MTEAEKYLWKRIRKKQINGLRFRRQYSVKGFVLDFYCPEIKLAIEIDGEYHYKGYQPIYDRERQRLLEWLGISFIRFRNNEVMENIEKVLDKILQLSTAKLVCPLIRGKHEFSNQKLTIHKGVTQ